MKTQRIVRLALLFVLLLAAVPASTLADNPPPAHALFNGDRFADLAIGVPNEHVGSTGDAGAVNVAYGSKSGLLSGNDQIWDQESTNVLETSESGDYFGHALAIGDFNGDSYPDLAIGVPAEAIGTVASAGIVQVLYGTPGGLSAHGNEVWHQGVAGVPGDVEAGDDLGYALAAGDFDGDGFCDLAIGVPFEDVGSADNAGAVNILYGSRTGLTSTGSQLWDQNSTGVPDDAEANDWFGRALTVGDFDGNGMADLAIGVPGESAGTTASAGAVNVLYGSRDGLTATGSEIWRQGASGIQGSADANDEFGFALAAGDFNHDHRSDLAIGVPFEDIDGAGDAGVVNVIYGSASGLTSTGNGYWYQGSTGIAGVPEEDDYFGRALAAGDFDGNGYCDLAIGVPGEGVSGAASAGAVNVIYGASSGLKTTGNQIWDQDSTGIADSSEAADRFGWALAAGDFNGDGNCDLAIGVPDEDIGAIEDAGAVNVIMGTTEGLTDTNDEWWHQDATNVEGVAEAGDHFGSSLAASWTTHRVFLPRALKIH